MPDLPPADVVERIMALYERHGHRAYGEAVDQVGHAVQAAQLAERAGAPPALVVAALLHDVGHLLEDGADQADGFHERLGARLLEAWLPPSVVVPIALHVEAKRYLVATDSAYAARLSPASRRSLALQGGPFSPAEAERFAASPHAADAIQVRRWDDEAKVPDLVVPPMRSFADLIRRHVTWTAGSASV